MPYSSKQEGNKITVYKKSTGEVVGHTTPEKYKGYMAALHIHAAYGGKVPSPLVEYLKKSSL